MSLLMLCMVLELRMVKLQVSGMWDMGYPKKKLDVGFLECGTSQLIVPLKEHKQNESFSAMFQSVFGIFGADFW